MKTQQLKPRLLRLLRKKWVLEDFAGKKCPASNTIYLHTHYSIIHTFHIFWYTILKIQKMISQNISFGNLKKTLLSSPEFVTTSFHCDRLRHRKWNFTCAAPWVASFLRTSVAWSSLVELGEIGQLKSWKCWRIRFFWVYNAFKQP